MNLDNYIPKGQLEGFPKEVIAKMLEEQVKQGNKEDVEVFERLRLASFPSGFEWSDSVDGMNFWQTTLIDKNFDLFFSKYPKQEDVHNPYPKVMLVSNDGIQWIKRVVFMEKNSHYISWMGAESLEDAQSVLGTSVWKYAREVEVAPMSPQSLEERIEAIEKHLNLNL